MIIVIVSKGFKLNGNLTKHMRETFKTVNVLNAMKIIATNVSSLRSELKSHKNSIHSTEKPFKCLFENCGKKYGNKRCLSRHLNTMHKHGENV